MIAHETAIESRPAADREQRSRPRDGARWEALLSADEERALSARILRGDQAARRKLILANLRVVVEIAQRYRGTKVPLDDLIQEGNLGLIRASADFDPAVHGCRFYTYAEVWIKAFVRRALIANDSLIRVPQHVFLERLQSRRAVAVTGDAEHGLAAPVPADDEAEIVPLTEAIVDEQLPEQPVADQERRLLIEIALQILNPVEAWVIRERFGLEAILPEDREWSSPARQDDSESDDEADDDPDTQGRAYFHRRYVELQRDCGLSRDRVRQVEQIALKKLRHALGPRLLLAL